MRSIPITTNMGEGNSQPLEVQNTEFMFFKTEVLIPGAMEAKSGKSLLREIASVRKGWVGTQKMTENEFPIHPAFQGCFIEQSREGRRIKGGTELSPINKITSIVS